MGKIKKKGVKGECAAYITQKQAMRRLQVTLPNFRRLCMLKGIYPTDPRNRKKVGKGNSEHRVYYYAKDIAFLAREPLIETFRKLRIHQLKLKKAKERGDKEKFFKVRLNKPRYSLHALVKERYPSREEAIKDMTNSLNLLFVFARLPRLLQFNPALIHLSRRLCVEFLNYLIVLRAIRKAFITIKGFCIEAEILGIPITWVMPHVTTAHAPSDVDYRLMATCLEFDATLVGSILTHLYKQAGLAYPPKAAQRVDVDASNQFCTASQVHFEFLSSLTLPLKRNTSDVEVCDNDELQELQAIDEQVSSCIKREVEKQKQVKLFEGKRFFLNRETPKEVLCLIINSCGGQCSYDKNLCPGATFTEEDNVDFQVVDRPITNMKADRYYVQPQWVFDSLNAGRLLPVQDYLPGVSLPPHLSPFVGNNTDPTGLNQAQLLQRGGLTGVAPGLGAGAKDYVPPEADYLAGLVTLAQIRDRQLTKDLGGASEINSASGAARPKSSDKKGKETLLGKPVDSGSEEEEDSDEIDEDDSDDGDNESDEVEDDDEDSDGDLSDVEKGEEADQQNIHGKRRSAISMPPAKRKKQSDSPKKGKSSDQSVKKNKKPVVVRPGKGESKVAQENKIREEANNARTMREMLMSKKHKHVYNKMTHSVKRRDKEIRQLQERRLAHDIGLK